MDETDRKPSLEPNVEKPLFRQKMFFEVAAAQSSRRTTNPHLPDSLLTPLVTVLDPCTLNSSIHARINWKAVEIRMEREESARQRGRPVQRARHASTDSGNTSDVSARSRSDSPRQPMMVRAKNGQGRMDPLKHMSEEERRVRSENEQFINEIIELVRDIKKYSDPALSSSQTWIEKTFVERISKQLVMISSYLPGHINIEEMVNALLFEHGIQILENVMIEMPENLVTIVNILINNSTPGVRMRYRNALITKIVQIYPYFVNRIVEKFSKSRHDCIFSARLAVEFLGDRHFLEFLEPLLTDKESMLSKTIFRSGGRQILSIIIERLLKMAQNVLTWQAAPTSEAPEMGEAPWCTRLSFCLVDLLNSTLEEWKEPDILTLCRFVFRTSTAPESKDLEKVLEKAPEPMETDFQDSMDSVVPDSDPESQAIFRPTIPAKTQVDQSPFGDAHEIFVLAALIAVPVFTQYPVNQTGAVKPPHRAVDDWLDISRKRVLMGKKVVNSFGTHLIFVHSCIMSSRIEELADFASEGMKRRVELDQQNHTLVLKNTFTSRCMTEMEVAKRSVCQLVSRSVGVTNAGRKRDPLALRSIHALQAAGVYTTFQIDIGEWLEEQLEHVSIPASELLADLVDGFAQSSASSSRKGLTKQFVETAFDGSIFDGRTIAKRLFVLLYLCSYREAAHKLDSSLRNMYYDMTVFRKIPVRYLLSIMEQQHENFESVRSLIITRTAEIFPYMLPTPDSMNLVEKYQKSAEKEVIEEEEFGCEREARIQMIRDQKDVIKMLEVIDRSTIRDQLAAIPILLEVYMESLSSTSMGYSALLISLYNRYEHLDPRGLFEKSVATWLRHDDGVTLDDVEKIPSLLFRCDRRILSSPPHFHCFIRCLDFFNKMVRAENRLKLLMIQTQVASTNAHYRTEIDHERKEKELINGAYLDNQHSVLIHALIEVSDSKRMKDDPSDFVVLERRRQVRRIACEYIHRQFLDHPGLIRIVLYQKFPLHQVRDLVEGVPALFAGTSQILEMLSIADQQRRFFAIVFASEICRKYRVRESLDAARSVCDVVHSLHKFGELPSSNQLWKHVAPALMLLAKEFPSLSDSIIRLLTRVSACAKNRLAVRCGLLAGDPRHEEYELIATIATFLDRNLVRQRL